MNTSMGQKAADKTLIYTAKRKTSYYHIYQRAQLRHVGAYVLLSKLETGE